MYHKPELVEDSEDEKAEPTKEAIERFEAWAKEYEMLTSFIPPSCYKRS